jgi:hypothetical protein
MGASDGLRSREPWMLTTKANPVFSLGFEGWAVCLT